MNNYKKKILINLAVLVGFVFYFYLINCIFSNYGKEKFTDLYKYISLGILSIAIVVFEIAYRKENGIIALYGIEIFVLSINSIISFNMINKFNLTFSQYINDSCFIYLLYYILKFVIIYTPKLVIL